MSMGPGPGDGVNGKGHRRGCEDPVGLFRCVCRSLFESTQLQVMGRHNSKSEDNNRKI